jgi:hypothetical protein
MTNRMKRGGTPGRARDAHQRPGDFEYGHRKHGGRTRGTPNAFSADYKKAIVEAAYRIGYDGNGKYGLVGYFMWIAIDHARTYGSLLPHVFSLQALECNLPEEGLPTVEQVNERAREYIGATGENCSPTQSGRRESQTDSRDWTGQDFPLSTLMHVAVENPKAFCSLIIAAFLRSDTKRRQPSRPRWSV